MSRTWIDRLSSALVAVLVLAATAAPQGPPPLPDGVSIGSLLAEGGDLASLASQSDARYVLKTFVGEAGRAEQRGQRKEYVLAECTGGGAVVDLWLADLRGQLRIYVDGSPIPVVDVEAVTALTGELTLFPPSTAHRAATGGRLIYPLPFRGSVKVTYSLACPFEVACRRYEDGVTVHSYDPNMAVQSFFTARAALAGWENMALPPQEKLVGGRYVLMPATTEVLLEPKKAKVIYEKQTVSPRAIVQFSVERVGKMAPLVTWERVRIRATFDGRKTIDASLADFLGEVASIDDDPTRFAASCKKAGGAVHWSAIRLPMPYRESVKLEVFHDGIRPGGTLRIHVQEAPFDWNEETLHLHARTDSGRGRPGFTLSGVGVLVGFVLRRPSPVSESLRLTAANEEHATAIWRHFSSDGRPASAHSSPLCRVSPGKALRWRILDRIPFPDGLKIAAESVESAEGGPLDLPWATTAFWYAPPPQKTK